MPEETVVPPVEQDVLFNRVKRSLRVSAAAFDDEIKDLISAAKREMERAGIVVDESNDLTRQAIIQYCKSRFGYDNKEAERFERNFHEMLKAMSLSGEFCE